MPEQVAETVHKPGTVLRYRSDRAEAGERDAYWCLEGTAVVRDNGAAFDTFWDSGSEAHRLTASELARAEVLFDLDDYDEMDRWRPDEQKWLTYAPEDRQRVTSQHGLQRRLYLRKGARPHRQTVLSNLRETVEEAEAEARSAQRNMEHAQEDLAALLAAPQDCSCRPSLCSRGDCVACADTAAWTECKALPARLGGEPNA